MALHHADRVRAVAGLNAPGLEPLLSTRSLLELLEHSPGIWDYHFYFQTPGVAEAEFEADVERFHLLMRRGTDPADGYDILREFDTARNAAAFYAATRTIHTAAA